MIVIRQILIIVLIYLILVDEAVTNFCAPIDRLSNVATKEGFIYARFEPRFKPALVACGGAGHTIA